MNNSCILGKGEITRLGYVRIEIKGKKLLAHRIAYESVYGEIPKNLEIDHLCHNKACVNVNHLEAVTHQLNSQRRRNTKLSLEKVAEIKKLISQKVKYKEIGKIYNVTATMICRINKGLAWKC